MTATLNKSLTLSDTAHGMESDLPYLGTDVLFLVTGLPCAGGPAKSQPPHWAPVCCEYCQRKLKQIKTAS